VHNLRQEDNPPGNSHREERAGEIFLKDSLPKIATAKVPLRIKVIK
jgi:hypothetical protein